MKTLPIFGVVLVLPKLYELIVPLLVMPTFTIPTLVIPSLSTIYWVLLVAGVVILEYEYI